MQLKDPVCKKLCIHLRIVPSAVSALAVSLLWSDLSTGMVLAVSLLHSGVVMAVDRSQVESTHRERREEASTEWSDRKAIEKLLRIYAMPFWARPSFQHPQKNAFVLALFRLASASMLLTTPTLCALRGMLCASVHLICVCSWTGDSSQMSVKTLDNYINLPIPMIWWNFACWCLYPLLSPALLQGGSRFYSYGNCNVDHNSSLILFSNTTKVKVCHNLGSSWRLHALKQLPWEICQADIDYSNYRIVATLAPVSSFIKYMPTIIKFVLFIFSGKMVFLLLPQKFSGWDGFWLAVCW